MRSEQGGYYLTILTEQGVVLSLIILISHFKVTVSSCSQWCRSEGDRGQWLLTWAAEGVVVSSGLPIPVSAKEIVKMRARSHETV